LDEEWDGMGRDEEHAELIHARELGSLGRASLASLLPRCFA